MDNPSRSQRTRNAALQAALAIIARDGPGRLTLDAIAKEGGISKGGLIHQFPSKRAVLQALLEHQVKHFSDFANAYMAEHGGGQAEPHLVAQIATLREAATGMNSVAFGLVAAIAEDPSLQAVTTKTDSDVIAAIKAEATDPDLAILRWLAAQGLLLMTLLRRSPFSEGERARLFDRLLDERPWSPASRSAPKGKLK